MCLLPCNRSRKEQSVSLKKRRSIEKMCGGPPLLTQLVCLPSALVEARRFGVRRRTPLGAVEADRPTEIGDVIGAVSIMASISTHRFMIRRSSRSALLPRAVRDEYQLDPGSRLGSFVSAGRGRSVSFRAFGERFGSGAPRRKSRHCEQLRLHLPQPSSRSRPAGDGATGHTAGEELPSTQ